jgi:hypothetical protein
VRALKPPGALAAIFSLSLYILLLMGCTGETDRERDRIALEQHVRNCIILERDGYSSSCVQSALRRGFKFDDVIAEISRQAAETPAPPKKSKKTKPRLKKENPE